MIRMTKISALLFALLFSAGAMAQSGANTSGTPVAISGDGKTSPPGGGVPADATMSNKKSDHKMKKVKQPRKTQQETNVDMKKRMKDSSGTIPSSN